MNTLGGQPMPTVYADVHHGHDDKHHYHAQLAIDPRFGPVLRLGFIPALREGEEPVMPMTSEQLRELALGALRMADDWAARDVRG